MQIVNPGFVQGKKVILRLDIDVTIEEGQVREDFRLRAGLPTLKLCLEHAAEVIAIGHIGRPSFAEATEGKPDKFFVPIYSVEPIREWFSGHGYKADLETGKLKLLENLRFDPREEDGDIEYAKELAQMGEVYVNEAFASYRPAVSTTILPTLMPHAAGLRFAEEVRVLREVRENPKKPFVAIMGGAKVEDKLAVIKVLAQRADAVLVGGKLIKEIREQSVKLPDNVLVGKLNEDGFDIAEETTDSWQGLISRAAMIVWNGPVGKIENNESTRGTYELAKMVLDSKAEIVTGGGDIVGFLGKVGLLGEFEQKGFVSVGGGAMLKLLSDGTLPTIEALLLS